MTKRSKKVSNAYTQPCPVCGVGTISVSETMGYTPEEIQEYFKCAICRDGEDAYWESIAKTPEDAWVPED